MVTTLVPAPPNEASAETIEQQFRRLEQRWRADTLFLSDAEKIIAHPAFQEIIGLGHAVIPLLMHQLEESPQLWVWALPRITGVNPVSPSDNGNIRKMSEAWLVWGRAQGLR